MALFGNLFRKRKARKQEKHADEQFLDAIEIIKESAQLYLELLAQARQDGNNESAERLNTKLNSTFDYFIKNWNGEVRVVNTITSECYVAINEKKLKIA
jgi:hypothetical protein